MRNFQNTFETRKQSFFSAFFHLHDCAFTFRSTRALHFPDRRKYIKKLYAQMYQPNFIDISIAL